MNPINLSPAQLRQAASLKEQVATLQHQLEAIFGGSAAAAPAVKAVVAKKGGMSAAGKARIVAAQKARWAKVNAAKTATAVKPVVKVAAAKAVVKAVVAKKGGMSAAGKGRIVAAQKLRWAKVKAAKK